MCASLLQYGASATLHMYGLDMFHLCLNLYRQPHLNLILINLSILRLRHSAWTMSPYNVMRMMLF